MRSCSSSAASYRRLTRISRCMRGAAMAGTSFMGPFRCAYVAQNARARPPREAPRRAAPRAEPSLLSQSLLRRGVLADLAEHDARPALLRQLQVDARGRQIHQCAGVIDREGVMGASAKLGELERIRALYPARGMPRHRLEHALHPVLVLQPERHHLELQRTDRAENHLVVAQRPEQPRGALLAQLRQALLQRLGAQRVLEHGAAEDLWGEVRHTGEGEPLALGEGIADVDGAVIVQADDVARPGLFRLRAVGGQA